MSKSYAVVSWLCKCGTRIKVIGAVNTDTPLRAEKVRCPTCGAGQILYMNQIDSIVEERVADTNLSFV